MAMRLKLTCAIVGALLATAPADAQSGQSAWAALTQADVIFIRDKLKSDDIYAIIGDPAFQNTYERATAEAERAAPTAKSFAEYAATLRRYVGAFQDPHAQLYLTIKQSPIEWAGFLIRLRGERYIVVGSKDARVIDGAEVSSCDGQSMPALADAMAPLEQAIPGLQAMRARMATLMTVDMGNPYRRRPASCTIAGVPVALTWRPIGTDALAIANAPFASLHDETIWSKPFGANGSWIHMGVFSADAAQAAQFRALYAALPAMRTQDVIVVDVRGNGGGSYNWFMGFLRALYGDDYTAYYARARLKIRPLYSDLNPPDSSSADTTGVTEPSDPPLERAEARTSRVDLPNGRHVTRTAAIPEAVDPTTPPPLNPVHARVLLLTDNGCASACIGFSDELLRFPGVEQIGADTYVDRLSGSAMSSSLPSGNGFLDLPSMIRIGRLRGDNVALKPSIPFDGDMADTPAVQAWIVNTVLKRLPAKPAAARR